MNYVFVGERRSATAIKRSWHWTDRRLCASTLLRILEELGVDHKNDCLFLNAYDDKGRPQYDNLREIHNRGVEGWVVIGMGRTVQKILTNEGITHRQMTHPAARGTIRKHENYKLHVKDVLFAEEE